MTLEEMQKLHEVETVFDEKPSPWTVKELREVLRGLPDDLEIVISREMGERERWGPDTHYVHEPVTRVEDAKEYLIIK